MHVSLSGKFNEGNDAFEANIIVQPALQVMAVSQIMKESDQPSVLFFCEQIKDQAVPLLQKNRAFSNSNGLIVAAR